MGKLKYGKLRDMLKMKQVENCSLDLKAGTLAPNCTLLIMVAVICDSLFNKQIFILHLL